MEDLIGANTFDTTLLQRSDVIKISLQNVYGTVTVPDGVEFRIGQILRTQDGGETFESMTETVWDAADPAAALDAVVYHNGHIYTSLIADNAVEPGTDPAKWQDDGAWNANGILAEHISLTQKAVVETMCTVVKRNLNGLETGMLKTLFDNKIIAK